MLSTVTRMYITQHLNIYSLEFLMNNREIEIHYFLFFLSYETIDYNRKYQLLNEILIIDLQNTELFQPSC